MLEAAYLAGLCQSTASTGAAHALSHAATKVCGAPHAAATAFFLVPALRWNRAKNAALYSRLEDVADLAARSGVPLTFTELLGRTLDSSERQSLAESAARDICLRTNPCRMSVADLVQLLAEIA
jgi:alcohol dehydrogenase class IV